jgi:hypothetical protein
MLYSLVKKDFILAKKYLIFLAIFAVAAPIFITAKMDFSSGSFLGFFVIALLVEYSLFGTVSMLEEKYKGSALLCATPYTRNALVKAKYIFILVTFILIYIIYTITAFVVPVGIVKLNIYTFGISLLIITIYFGVIMPIQYKFGYGKTQYISYAIIFLSPFVIPSIFKWLQANNISFHFTISLPEAIQNIVPYVFALLIGVVSMILSINIYSKKDL